MMAGERRSHRTAPSGNNHDTRVETVTTNTLSQTELVLALIPRVAEGGVASWFTRGILVSLPVVSSGRVGTDWLDSSG